VLDIEIPDVIILRNRTVGCTIRRVCVAEPASQSLRRRLSNSGDTPKVLATSLELKGMKSSTIINIYCRWLSDTLDGRKYKNNYDVKII